MVVGSVSRGCEVVVIGGGPGGYLAAIRLGQLGKDVLLVEKDARLGGVCLNRGCIPSKALIHGSDLAWEASHAKDMGITVEGLSVDLPAMVKWKDGIVQRLTGGVKFLCDKAGVEVVQGRAEFLSDRTLAVHTEAGVGEITFEQAVIATGSVAMDLPDLPRDGEHVIGSREALSLPAIPEKLVVIGAGYIGLELGTVYAKLGSHVEIVEFLPELLPVLDPEVAKVMARRLKELGIKLHLEHRAATFEAGEPGTLVALGPHDKELRLPADKVLVTVGRKPNTDKLGLEKIGVERDDKGFITVNDKQQTSVPGIYAIGDAAGGVLLAHKAYWEGKVAAEVIVGEPAAFDQVAIPAVIYTDPEIAWVGLTEKRAKEQGFEVMTGTFQLRALGRAMTLGATDGFVKAIADKATQRLLGITAVGRGVSEIITEGALALEMGAFLEDVALTIHPHPTMSEALVEAVEATLGISAHMVNPSKPKK